MRFQALHDAGGLHLFFGIGKLGVNTTPILNPKPRTHLHGWDQLEAFGRPANPPGNLQKFGVLFRNPADMTIILITRSATGTPVSVENTPAVGFGILNFET